MQSKPKAEGSTQNGGTLCRQTIAKNACQGRITGVIKGKGEISKEVACLSGPILKQDMTLMYLVHSSLNPHLEVVVLLYSADIKL